MIRDEDDWASKVDRFRAFDLETYLIENGLLAPRVVVGSEAWAEGDGTIAGRLLHPAAAAVNRAYEMLRASTVLVLANGSFDLACVAQGRQAVLDAVFRAYEEGRVYDVQVAQALNAIADGHFLLEPNTGEAMRGRYSLETCVRQVLGRDDAKENDLWRMRYALLADVPLEDWPEEARVYPVDDARNTLEVARAQVLGGGAGPTPGPHRNLSRLADEAEAQWCLHLGAVWGARVDQTRVRRLRERAEREHAAHVEKMRKLGLFALDKKSGEWKKDRRAVKRRIVRAYSEGEPGRCPAADDPANPCRGGEVLNAKGTRAIICKVCDGTGLDISQAVPTPAGGVKGDRDVLVESGDEDLIALGDNEAEKILETYLPKLETEELTRHLQPNVLVESMRTSYFGLIQLLPREGDVRPCIRARGAWCGSPTEYVFVDCDYAAIELATLAQVYYWLFEESPMMEAINAAGDPGVLHTALAARMRGVTLQQMQAWLKSPDLRVKEEAKKYRFAAKALNFGLPGGMGAAKLVLSKRSRANGETTGPDGRVYPGVRFCLLIPDPETGRTQEVCGLERVREWRGRSTPPICKACVSLVDRELKPMWVEQWDMQRYFDWVSGRVEIDGWLPCWGTDAVRGGLDFPSGCNHSFQNLAALGAKHALRAVSRECYTDRNSLLWGARPIFFTHDSITGELIADRAHGAAHRMADIMIERMRDYVPDVAVDVKPALMRYYYKSAEPAYVGPGGELDPKTGKPYGENASGRTLVPWDDYYVKEAA